MRIWKLEDLSSYLAALLTRRGFYRGRRFLPTFTSSFLLAFLFLGIFHSVASAQINLDGVMDEPEWHKLRSSNGGPPPSFGTGNEINALYADIDPTSFYIGVAGNVQNGNRILIFIDSLPGGYSKSN